MAGMPIRRARRARRNPGVMVMSPRSPGSPAKVQTALKLLESAIHLARFGKYAEASEKLAKGAEKVPEISAMYPAAASKYAAFLRSAEDYVSGRGAPYAVPMALYAKLPASVKKNDEHPHEGWVPQGVVNQLYEAMRDRDFDTLLSAPSTLPVSLEDMEKMYSVLEGAVGYPFREERKAHHIRKRR